MATATVLALSGCSSDSSDEGTPQPTPSVTASAQQPSPTASKTGAAASTTAATPQQSGDPTQSVGGVWLATQDGARVQLVLGKGKAALTSTSLCGGSYTDQDGIGLTLTCMDGNKDRTTGHGILAGDGKTLTVEWSGGLTDTFTRTGLPSG